MSIIDSILKEAKYKSKTSTLKEERKIISSNVIKDPIITNPPVIQEKVQLEKKNDTESNIGIVINELVSRIKTVEEKVQQIQESTVSVNKLPIYNFTIKRDKGGKIESVLAVSSNEDVKS